MQWGRQALSFVVLLVLARLYKDRTDQRPTRRHDAYKQKDYGLFRDFVIAVLKPMNPQALTGINDAIKEAVKLYGKISA